MPFVYLQATSTNTIDRITTVQTRIEELYACNPTSPRHLLQLKLITTTHYQI